MSTGARTLAEAERIAAEWLVNGKPAKQAPQKRADVSLLSAIKKANITETEADAIFTELVRRGFFVSAIKPSTPQARTLGDYLTEFWDFEKSEYLNEKRRSKTVFERHIKEQLSAIKKYWLAPLGNKLMGELTRQDLGKR
jgi:hypothetical protein